MSTWTMGTASPLFDERRGVVGPSPETCAACGRPLAGNVPVFVAKCYFDGLTRHLDCHEMVKVLGKLGEALRAVGEAVRP